MGFCERRWAQVDDLSPNCLPVCPRKLANQVTVCACVLSRFSCIRLCKTQWTVARQASLSMGILQARILEEVAIQGIFPNQGLNPGLPHCRGILYHLSHQGSPPKQTAPRFLTHRNWVINVLKSLNFRLMYYAIIDK